MIPDIQTAIGTKVKVIALTKSQGKVGTIARHHEDGKGCDVEGLPLYAPGQPAWQAMAGRLPAFYYEELELLTD